MHTPMNPGLRDRVAALYGHASLEAQLARWEALAIRLEAFSGPGSAGSARAFSAPGRSELGGNHTDHNHGWVLAASIDLDTIALVCPRREARVRIASLDYPDFEVELDSLAARPAERGSSAALVRGVADWFVSHGHAVAGFDAVVSSTVLRGSGLSSSASFEVLVACVFNQLANAGRLDPIQLGLAGQYAENHHFGKPCGLMDQIACAHGGVVAIDFARPGQPALRAIARDFAAFGHALLIVAVGDDHADLTHEYAAIPQEMQAVASLLGAPVLAGVRIGELMARAPEIRGKLGDRAFLRSLHFLGETERPARMAAALEAGDFGRYLALANASGRSSQSLLQNLHVAGATRSQAMDCALAVSEWLLQGSGACRVHGGGFGGTIQAIVPFERLEAYRAGMEALLGPGTVHRLAIRLAGVCEL